MATAQVTPTTTADADGYDSTAYGGDDCRDDPEDDDYLIHAQDVFPGAEDEWYDGVDQDCAGDSDFDADLDGYTYAESADATDYRRRTSHRGRL